MSDKFSAVTNYVSPRPLYRDIRHSQGIAMYGYKVHELNSTSRAQRGATRFSSEFRVETSLCISDLLAVPLDDNAECKAMYEHPEHAFQEILISCASLGILNMHDIACQ